MLKSTSRELRKLRPRLRTVAPHSYWFVMLLGVFNLLFGASLMAAVDKGKTNSSLLIVNDFFTFQMWGAVFILLGVLKLSALRLNRWRLARLTLMMGVVVKAAWMVALVIRVFVSPGTVIIALLWMTLATAQMLCYIYFLPAVRPGPKGVGRRV